MNFLPEPRDPVIQQMLFKRPATLPAHDVVGATFNPPYVAYIPTAEPGESYESHIKHLNLANRYLYG